MNLSIPVSIGELYDKISILEIKAQKISDAEKLVFINKELSLLRDIAAQFPIEDADYAELKAVNAELWEIEDAIRGEESARRFEKEFIALARNVYITNDRRSEIKRRINISFHSEIVEVKSYKS